MLLFSNILLLLFYNFCTIPKTFGYNIAVDITKHGVESYFSHMRPYFIEKLHNWVIPPMEYSSFLCGVNLEKAKIKNSKIGHFHSSLEGPQEEYYLKLSKMNFTISGVYDRNFMFFHTSNPYSINVELSSIVVGPIVPISSDGLPFIDLTLNCEIGKVIVSNPVTNGWFVKSLIRNAVNENFKTELCYQLITQLDEHLRNNIGLLELHFPIVHNFSTLDYRIYRPPIVLPSKSIRYHLDGSTNELRLLRGGSINPADVALSNNTSKRHVAFYIHEKLLTQISETLCNSGYFDANYTSFPSNKNVVFTCLSTDVKIQYDSKTPSVFLGITSFEKYDNEEHELKHFRTFMITVLHNHDFELMIRLKSQISDSTVDNSFKEQLFTHISKILFENFNLPLPLVIGFAISDVIFMFNEQYFTIMANLEPDTQHQIDKF